jgi:hypothetical protein
VAALLAGAHAVDPSPVGVFYDDAHYVILGRALALGDGYRYINVPGSPAATHFPPGYPALLALLWKISPVFPENIALFKMTNVVLLGVVAFVVFRAAQVLGGLRVPGATVVALASTITIPSLVLGSSVMSEMLFLALLIPFLLKAEDAMGHDGLARAALLGSAAGVLCLVRSHGVALLPAVAIAYSLQRRHREALVCAGFAVLVLLPWFLWVRQHDPLLPEPLRGQYGSYTAWLLDGFRAGGVGLVFATLRDNAVTAFIALARSFNAPSTQALDAVAATAVLTLLAAGAVDLAKRATVTVLFTAVYLGITLVWPFSPLRFLWGIWPILILLMVCGVRRLWSAPATGRAPRLRRGVAVVAATIAIVGALNFNVRGYMNAWWATVSRSFTPRIRSQLVWVSEKTRPTDVVVTDDDGAVYLYTGRRALPASAFTVGQYFRPRSADENARWLGNMVRTLSPDYVVAWAQPTLDAAAILAAARPPVLLQVDTIPRGRVYRPAP